MTKTKRRATAVRANDKDKRYNGWTNYETWLVALWQDNDEGSYRYWRDVARHTYDVAEASPGFTKAEQAALDLSDMLKDSYEEQKDTVVEAGVADVWADLLGAALCEVNWYEIAEGMIEEAAGE